MAEVFFEEVVREAKVLDLGRKGDVDCAAAGEVGEGTEKAGCDGERVPETSEEAESDLPPMGTMRLCILLDGLAGSAETTPANPSGGISSAAGMGSPLPAATS